MERYYGLNVYKDNVFICILTKSGERIEEHFSTLTSELGRP